MCKWFPFFLSIDRINLTYAAATIRLSDTGRGATLPGWVGVGEPRRRLGGLYAKNVTICPTQA